MIRSQKETARWSQGQTVLPGLIDCHTHQNTLLIPYIDVACTRQTLTVLETKALRKSPPMVRVKMSGSKDGDLMKPMNTGVTRTISMPSQPLQPGFYLPVRLWLFCSKVWTRWNWRKPRLTDPVGKDWTVRWQFDQLDHAGVAASQLFFGSFTKSAQSYERCQNMVKRALNTTLLMDSLQLVKWDGWSHIPLLSLPRRD